MTEVRFAFTPQEAHLRWMLEVLYARMWMWLRTAGLTLAIVGAFVFGYVERPLGVALIVVGLALLVLPPLYKRVVVTQMVASPLMAQRDVVISLSAVEVTMSDCAMRYDTSLLTGVVQDKPGWLLIIGGVATAIVPHAALTADQVQFMTTFAAQHRGNAGSRPN